MSSAASNGTISSPEKLTLIVHAAWPRASTHPPSRLRAAIATWLAASPYPQLGSYSSQLSNLGHYLRIHQPALWLDPSYPWPKLKSVLLSPESHGAFRLQESQGTQIVTLDEAALHHLLGGRGGSSTSTSPTPTPLHSATVAVSGYRESPRPISPALTVKTKTETVPTAIERSHYAVVPPSSSSSGGFSARGVPKPPGGPENPTLTVGSAVAAAAVAPLARTPSTSTVPTARHVAGGTATIAATLTAQATAPATATAIRTTAPYPSPRQAPIVQNAAATANTSSFFRAAFPVSPLPSTLSSSSSAAGDKPRPPPLPFIYAALAAWLSTSPQPHLGPVHALLSEVGLYLRNEQTALWRNPRYAWPGVKALLTDPAAKGVFVVEVPPGLRAEVVRLDLEALQRAAIKARARGASVSGSIPAPSGSGGASGLGSASGLASRPTPGLACGLASEPRASGLEPSGASAARAGGAGGSSIVGSNLGNRQHGAEDLHDGQGAGQGRLGPGQMDTTSSPHSSRKRDRDQVRQQPQDEQHLKHKQGTAAAIDVLLTELGLAPTVATNSFPEHRTPSAASATTLLPRPADSLLPTPTPALPPPTPAGRHDKVSVVRLLHSAFPLGSPTSSPPSSITAATPTSMPPSPSSTSTSWRHQLYLEIGSWLASTPSPSIGAHTALLAALGAHLHSNHADLWPPHDNLSAKLKGLLTDSGARGVFVVEMPTGRQAEVVRLDLEALRSAGGGAVEVGRGATASGQLRLEKAVGLAVEGGREAGQNAPMAETVIAGVVGRSLEERAAVGAHARAVGNEVDDDAARRRNDVAAAAAAAAWPGDDALSRVRRQAAVLLARMQEPGPLGHRHAMLMANMGVQLNKLEPHAMADLKHNYPSRKLRQFLDTQLEDALLQPTTTKTTTTATTTTGAHDTYGTVGSSNSNRSSSATGSKTHDSDGDGNGDVSGNVLAAAAGGTAGSTAFLRVIQGPFDSVVLLDLRGMLRWHHHNQQLLRQRHRQQQRPASATPAGDLDAAGIPGSAYTATTAMGLAATTTTTTAAAAAGAPEQSRPQAAPVSTGLGQRGLTDSATAVPRAASTAAGVRKGGPAVDGAPGIASSSSSNTAAVASGGDTERSSVINRGTAANGTTRDGNGDTMACCPNGAVRLRNAAEVALSAGDVTLASAESQPVSAFRGTERAVGGSSRDQRAVEVLQAPVQVPLVVGPQVHELVEVPVAAGVKMLWPGEDVTSSLRRLAVLSLAAAEEGPLGPHSMLWAKMSALLQKRVPGAASLLLQQHAEQPTSQPPSSSLSPPRRLDNKTALRQALDGAQADARAVAAAPPWDSRNASTSAAVPADDVIMRVLRNATDFVAVLDMSALRRALNAASAAAAESQCAADGGVSRITPTRIEADDSSPPSAATTAPDHAITDTGVRPTGASGPHPSIGTSAQVSVPSAAAGANTAALGSTSSAGHRGGASPIQQLLRELWRRFPAPASKATGRSTPSPSLYGRDKPGAVQGPAAEVEAAAVTAKRCMARLLAEAPLPHELPLAVLGSKVRQVLGDANIGRSLRVACQEEADVFEVKLLGKSTYVVRLVQSGLRSLAAAVAAATPGRAEAIAGPVDVVAPSVAAAAPLPRRANEGSAVLIAPPPATAAAAAPVPAAAVQATRLPSVTGEIGAAAVALAPPVPFREQTMAAVTVNGRGTDTVPSAVPLTNSVSKAPMPMPIPVPIPVALTAPTPSPSPASTDGNWAVHSVPGGPIKSDLAVLPISPLMDERFYIHTGAPSSAATTSASIQCTGSGGYVWARPVLTGISVQHICDPYRPEWDAMLRHCQVSPQVGIAVHSFAGQPSLVALYAPAAESGDPDGERPPPMPPAGTAATLSRRYACPATVYLVDCTACCQTPYGGGVGGESAASRLWGSMRWLLEETSVAKVVHGCEQVHCLEVMCGGALTCPLLDTRVVLSALACMLGLPTSSLPPGLPPALPPPPPASSQRQVLMSSDATTDMVLVGGLSNGIRGGSGALLDGRQLPAGRSDPAVAAAAAAAAAAARLLAHVGVLHDALSATGLWADRPELLSRLARRQFTALREEWLVVGGREGGWLDGPLTEGQAAAAADAAARLPELWAVLVEEAVPWVAVHAPIGTMERMRASAAAGNLAGKAPETGRRIA